MPYFSRKKPARIGIGDRPAYYLTELIDGQIQAGNHQPKGALFTFELPV